jgi:ribosome-associated heat shock protein Hsp15
VSGLRVDKWLWAARFFKTRSMASDAVSGGKVKVNGTATKPAREIKPGDCLVITNSATRWEVTVQTLSDKRGPAPEARLLYDETPESISAREAARESRQFVQDPAADIHGRPTKRNRRQMDRYGR